MTVSPLHILVVEDQQAIVANICQYFEGKGHIMDFAFNGEHGLELAFQGITTVSELMRVVPREET